MSLKQRVPLFFIPYTTYLVKDFYNFILVYSLLLVILLIISKKNNKYIYQIFIYCLSYFDSYILIASLLITNTNEIASRFLFISTLLFILIDNLYIPLAFGTVFFWGIPFILITSLIFTYLTRSCQSKKLEKTSIVIIFICIFLNLISYINDTGKHYIYNSKDEKYTNFIYNSTSSGNHGAGIPDKLESNDKISIFLFQDKGITEESVKNNFDKGNFYLYGEHDNLNDFIGENSQFENNRIHQKMPWSYNRPVMTRNLWIASLQDPFFCSNIGTTIKHDPFIVPLVWSYSKFGIPNIIIGKNYYKNKTITYIGDSDTAVYFLSPYNKHFLNALYYQFDINLLLKFLLLIFLIMLQNNIISTVYIFIIIILSILSLRYDNNIYDINVEYNGVKILSPHIDNSPDKLINELSKLKKTVSLNADNANNDIIIIGKNITKKINSNEIRKNSLFIIMEQAKLIIDSIAYYSGDIPLGTVLDKNIYINDAREIIKNSSPTGKSLLKINNIYIIATNSPQKFVDIVRILK